MDLPPLVSYVDIRFLSRIVRYLLSACQIFMSTCQKWHDQEINYFANIKSVFATYCHLLIIVISDKSTKRSDKMIKGYNYFFFVLLYMTSRHLCVTNKHNHLTNRLIDYLCWLVRSLCFLVQFLSRLVEKYSDNCMAQTVHVHVFGLNF